jgi:uncharacterized protein
VNRLSNERSAYLRHAGDQKIDWHPWSDEAFEKAQRENKPVFLSSGAIWCHWCHVMAKESFENDEVAAILNENYIAVKLDRDERPDVDRRYQQAIGAMGISGGWPLSMFLTPDKKPFYGGTYFPPVETQGMPAFATILLAVSQYYKDKRDEIEEQGTIFLNALKADGTPSGDLKPSTVDHAAENILLKIDKVHGGFGNAPKFPMSGAIEFLMGRYFLRGDEDMAFALKKTLLSMARGGFHDQIGGGFHRYSTDNAWGVPHFEKMTDDNAWLLRNYCDAFRAFGDPYFKYVAQRIMAFANKELTHPEGGFYASMDADVTPDDEGGYFTWTKEEFENVLTAHEFQAASAHLFNYKNIVHHAADKVVLSIVHDIDEIARAQGIKPDVVEEKIRIAKEKLLAQREKRQKPFIDTAVYTSLNGMMISAYCKAYRTFGENEILDRAVRSLKRVMAVNMLDGELFHSEGVKALLEDYVFFCDALIAVYEATGEIFYFDEAKRLFDICLERFWDRDGWGFFDTEDEVIGVRLKGIEDVPRPSPNALAVMVLLKIAAITGDEGYHRYAKDALKAFVSDAGKLFIHGAYYFCALDAYFRMMKLEIRADVSSEIARVALFTEYPYTCIVYTQSTDNLIVPCSGTTCFEPVNSADSLTAFLDSRRIGKA